MANEFAGSFANPISVTTALNFADINEATLQMTTNLSQKDITYFGIFA